MRVAWLPGLIKSWFEKSGDRSRTPFDHLNGPEGPRTDHIDGPDGPLDVFISYKSEHARTARCAADYLLGAGQNVWFDEYVLLLRGRKRWERAITHGLETAKRGIAFISDLYVKSEPCRFELAQLLRNCEPANILVVRMDDGTLTLKDFPVLKKSPTWHFNERLDDLIAFIRQGHSALRLPPRESPQPRAGAIYKGAKLKYTINLSCWTLRSPEAGWQGRIEGFKEIVGLMGPRLEIQLGGQLANGNLIIGPLHGVDRKTTTAAGGDDREYQNELIEFVDNYCRSKGWKCGGVHTLHSQSGSNSAFTYFAEDRWVRKVTIDLPGAHGSGMEFVFTLAFPGTFREYCKYTPYMDALVESLHWAGAGDAPFAGWIDATRREELTDNIAFSYAPPVAWRKMSETRRGDSYDLDFRPETVDGDAMFDSLLNLQVSPCPPGKEICWLQARAERIIKQNAGRIRTSIVGRRHGVQTAEYLYEWVNQGKQEWGFEIHFILNGYCIMIQLSSVEPIDEREIMTPSAFAEGITITTRPRPTSD